MARHALSVFVWVMLGAGAALGQTTAFTYQGQLTDAGQAANGSFDLQFALFGAASGGAQIGSTQAVATVPVSGGVFTVQLDFGTSAFPGANRFLEIGLRPTGGGSFTTLAPRQQISSTPYAIRTLSAASADTLSSACVGCVTDSQINTVAGSKVSGPIPAASLPAGNGNYIQNTTTQQGSANFNVSGNGVVGGNLTVAGTLNANVSGNFIQNRSTPQTNTNFNISGNGTVGGTLSATNAGIGTTTPNHRLRISGGPLWTADGWLGEMELDNIGAIGWHANATGNRFGLGQTNGGLQFFATGSDPGTVASPVNYLLTFADNANVGIGTTTPTSKLEIAAQDGLAVTGPQPFLTLRDTSASNKRSFVQGVNGDVVLKTESGAGMVIKDGTGNVGLGAPAPNGKLDARGGAGIGVYGESAATNVNVPGVYGRSAGDGGSGVLGAADVGGGRGVYGASASATGVGVYGQNPAGYAMYANGNAAQALDKGGWVKAMAWVNPVGDVFRCYNSTQTGSDATTPPCNISVTEFTNGGYGVDFHFDVSDRIVSVTPQPFGSANLGANFTTGGTNNSTTVNVFTFYTADKSDKTGTEFTIIVF